MRRCATLLALLVAVAALESCNDGSGPSGHTDACGDIKPAMSGIINGVSSPELVTLTPGQMKAIGFMQVGWGGCTGTLVAPTVVLAAAHCVEDLSSSATVNFWVGDNYMSPERTIRAVEWHMHPSFAGSSGGMLVTPDYDISVIILAEDATVYGIEPIPVNLDTTRLAGETIQAVGFGLTSYPSGYNSRRWWTTLPVVAEMSLHYTIDGRGVTGVCQGDSGGPMLYDMPGKGVHVMGVVSSGAEGCTGLSHYARPDTPTVSDWLLEYIPLGPCGWEDLEGRCDGDTAVWCEDDMVWTHDCAEFGHVCGADDSGNMRCVEPPPPCADETWAGRCDGETAIWCESDVIMYHACADFDYYCGTNGEGLHRCVPDSCRGETARGRCDGDTAIWCEDGAVLYHACVDFGYVCGNDAEGNYRCVPPGASECDLLGHAGECVIRDGRDWARWCDRGVIKERDCTCDGGRSCVWTGDALGYYCI
ncbi:MAG: trypsin-like serine protease [Deltaproteobacteria bacterium]|nr:trypsin-like serine protease [Deltaproteobacteria bacterium]